MARIDLIKVSKTLTDRARPGSGAGATFSIRELTLRVPDGKTMVVLGPSGCGKTTLLKLIAGLIPPDSGEVRYDDVDVKEVPPGGRRIGMVFQNYALYPHVSSRTNVLSYFLFRKEDAGAQRAGQGQVSEDQRAHGGGVTHDHHEALVLADLVAVMDRGRIEQVGTFRDIYDRPKNVFVAGFLNLHTGSPPISFIDARSMPGEQDLGNVWVGIRPEHVEMSREQRDDALEGIVTGTLSLPPNDTLVTIRVGEHEVHARTSGDEHGLTGSQVWLTFKQYHLFDRESGTRLRSCPEIL
jgi:ABC-type sugar transport system ATPase subunit